MKKTLYKCEKCRDIGWIPIKQEKTNDIIVRCDCMRDKKLKGEWKSSGIRTDMCKFTFRNFTPWNEISKYAKNVAMGYFKEFNNIREKRINSILLCGQVGSGKTHLAVAIAINLLETKVKVVYMPYRDVLTDIKQNILDNAYYKKAINKFKTCDVLLIDDLFKGKINETDINIIFEIINYRYLNCLPMIISSELTIDKILTIDEAIGSRIYEMSKSYIIQVENDIRNNYRLK